MPTCDERGEGGTCRAGRGGAGRTWFEDVAKALAPLSPVTELEDDVVLEGLLRGRGHGRVPGVTVSAQSLAALVLDWLVLTIWPSSGKIQKIIFKRSSFFTYVDCLCRLST